MSRFGSSSSSLPPYSRFVTTDNLHPLDCSRGQVQLIGGDFYYSPNSQRTVNLPPVFNSIPYRDCHKDPSTEFRQPLWWQPACPYLAFMPLHPVFAGVPFQDLFHISYIPRLRYGGFTIDPQIILGWAHLEKDIRDTVELLLSHEGAPSIAWIVRMSLGCTGIFRQARARPSRQFCAFQDLVCFIHGCPFLCHRGQYIRPSRTSLRGNATLVLVFIPAGGLFADLAIRHKVVNRSYPRFICRSSRGFCSTVPTPSRPILC